MSGQFLYIQKKQKNNPALVADVSDFDYLEGEKIDDIAQVVSQRNVSLYCLDHQQKQVIFVETPSDIDIFAYPFLYQAQFEYAHRLIAISYETICQLAQTFKIPDNQLIFIYPVGRCGSTLLSRIFHQVEYVISLSEPDIFSQIVGLRMPDKSNDCQLAELLLVLTALLCKPNQLKNPSFYVFKLRGFCIEIADILHKVFPHSKGIFLYRDAQKVVESCIRAFDPYMSSHLLLIKEKKNFYNRFITLFEEYSDLIDYSNSIDFYLVRWLSYMHRYLWLYQQKLPLCAIRYEDLTTHPKQIISYLFDYCGLSIEIESIILEIDKLLKTDSQNNSIFSWQNTRRNKVSNLSEIHQKTTRILQKHPEIRKSNFILPGTVKIKDNKD